MNIQMPEGMPVMQQPTTNWQKVFNDRMDDFKRETIFPDEKLPANFTYTISQAFRFHSPNHIKMQVADYCDLLRKNGNYNLLEMEHIFAAMQNKTMFQLNMEIPEYCDYITNMQALIDVWAEIIRTEGAEMQKQVEAERDAEMSTSEMIKEEVLDGE